MRLGRLFRYTSTVIPNKKLWINAQICSAIINLFQIYAVFFPAVILVNILLFKIKTCNGKRREFDIPGTLKFENLEAF